MSTEKTRTDPVTTQALDTLGEVDLEALRDVLATYGYGRTTDIIRKLEHAQKLTVGRCWTCGHRFVDGHADWCASMFRRKR